MKARLLVNLWVLQSVWPFTDKTRTVVQTARREIFADFGRSIFLVLADKFRDSCLSLCVLALKIG